MKAFISLLITTFKRDFRDINTLIFAFLIPIAFIFLFGTLFANRGASQFDLGIVDYAKNDDSKVFVETLKKTEAFTTKDYSEEELKSKIEKGDIPMGIVIPKDFNKDSTTKINFYTNAGKQQETSIAGQILSQVIDKGYNYRGIPERLKLEKTDINSRNLGILDFLIPGLIANSIMQLGVFGVAFAFISQRNSGVFKRLLATPIKAYHIIFAEGLESVIMTLAQIGVLLGFGVLVYKIQIVGNLLLFFLLAILGIVVFLGMGYTIAGIAKDEKQAPALANLISLPMIMLSGVFFSRTIFPEWLQKITDFFPLTFLVDGMREVLNNGAGLDVIGKDILGLLVWGIVTVFLAYKVFKWE